MRLTQQRKKMFFKVMKKLVNIRYDKLSLANPQWVGAMSTG